MIYFLYWFFFLKHIWSSIQYWSLFIICNYFYQFCFYTYLIKVDFGEVRMLEAALRYSIYVQKFSYTHLNLLSDKMEWNSFANFDPACLVVVSNLMAQPEVGIDESSQSKGRGFNPLTGIQDRSGVKATQIWLIQIAWFFFDTSNDC